MLIAALVVAGLLLAWIDSTALRALFPQPMGPPRRAPLRPAELPRPLPFAGERREGLLFLGLGPVGGLYSFWWFLASGAGLFLLLLPVLVAFPSRVRRAAERVQPQALSLMFVAGVATTLLVLAATLLLRTTFILLTFVPFVWAVAVAGVIFGLAALAAAAGRWLRRRLGEVDPLLAALAAILALYDLALVPVLGWVAMGAVVLAALGLAVITRLGSERGWSLEELR